MACCWLQSRVGYDAEARIEIAEREPVVRCDGVTIEEAVGRELDREPSHDIAGGQCVTDSGGSKAQGPATDLDVDGAAER